MKYFSFFCFLFITTSLLSQNKDSLITIHLKEEIPIEVNLKPNFTSIKNQGNRGACAYFSTCSLIEAEYKKHGKYINVSEQFLSYIGKRTTERQVFGKTEASNVGLDLEAAIKHCVLQEYHWPYQFSWFEYGYPCYGYPKNDSTPSECYSENRPPNSVLSEIFKINGEIIELASNIDSVLYYIGKEKIALAFLFPSNLEQYYKNNGHIEWNDSLHENWINSKGGNHYLVICGYDLKKQLLYIRNSWGKEWGNNGYGTMSFYDFNKYCYYDLDGFKLKNPEINSIKIKKDKEVEVNYFKVKTIQQENDWIKISTRGSVKNLERHSIMLRSKLVYQPIESTITPTDSSIVVVELSNEDQLKFNDQYVRGSWIYIPFTEHKSGKWHNHKKINYYIHNSLIQSKSVQDLVKSGKYKFFVKTTLYTFTDKEAEIKLDYKFQEVKL